MIFNLIISFGSMFHRFNNRSKIKLGHAIKSNITGERFAWFTDELERFEGQTCLMPTQFDELFEK